MTQYVRVENPENPLNEAVIEVEVRRGDKILSKASNVAELYAMYEGYIDNPKDFGDIEDDHIQESLITDVTEKYATVELNKKYSTVIDISKEKKEYLSYIQPLARVNLKVSLTKKTNSYSASFSNAVEQGKFNAIHTSIGESVAYIARVKELIHGGYYVDIDGISCFMPGSLASMNKLSNFEELVGKSLYVKAVNYSDKFNMVVVSHEDYLKQLIPMEIENIDYRRKYVGRITGVSRFGIFVEFNSESDMSKPFILTGLIPTSEMNDETLKDFNDRTYSAGDDFNFYVKTVVNPSKIILTDHYVDWDETFDSYEKGKKVNCKVVQIKGDIIFASIEGSSLVGTINNYDGKCEVGDSIKLAISFVDKKSKKIFLKGYK